MRFSLLTPPTDAPSRIPLSRGLPSANALAVNTSALPNALPLPALDPDAVALPYQALSRLAAAGLQASSDVSTLILAAEAKKREANDTAEIDRIYTQMTQDVDTDFAKMKLTETDETLVPAFNTMWKTRMDEALKQSSNKSVQAGVTAKANGLLRVKSGEVTTTNTKKFIERQTAEFDATVTTLENLATNPALTPEEQAIHEAELEKKYLTAAHTGFKPVDDLAKQRRTSLDFIAVTRAQTKATFDPETVLEDFASGNTYGLPAKHQRTIYDAATQQLRIQRSEKEHAAAEGRRLRQEQQNDATVGVRQQIIQNWEPGGARKSMIEVINGNARKLGDDNYRSLLETERIYQALATKPGPKKVSDSLVVGQLQATLTSDHWREVTQADLLRLLKADVLDDGDHRYLSNKLDSLTQEAKKPKPETDAEKDRKLKIKDAEKTIETFIERGSKYESAPSQVLARDAVMELHRQAAANPDVDPDDIATGLIAKKLAGYQQALDGLPYSDRESVQQAYKAGLLSKREAERYFAIFDLVEKTKPPKKETPPAPPGLLERWGIPNPFGTTPKPGEIRPPTKRKIP